MLPNDEIEFLAALPTDTLRIQRVHQLLALGWTYSELAPYVKVSLSKASLQRYIVSHPQIPAQVPSTLPEAPSPHPTPDPLPTTSRPRRNASPHTALPSLAATDPEIDKTLQLAKTYRSQHTEEHPAAIARAKISVLIGELWHDGHGIESIASGMAISEITVRKYLNLQEK